MGYLVKQSTLCVTNGLLSVPVNIIVCYQWVTYCTSHHYCVLLTGYLVYQSTLCVTNGLLSVPVNIILCYHWVT